jgi:hypothetical protein
LLLFKFGLLEEALFEISLISGGSLEGKTGNLDIF